MVCYAPRVVWLVLVGGWWLVVGGSWVTGHGVYY
jgi:hypothetical protein